LFDQQTNSHIKFPCVCKCCSKIYDFPFTHADQLVSRIL
jgi:hypothetical protein